MEWPYPRTAVRVSFNQSSYQTDEGSSFATAVVASPCYEGNFDVEIRTTDLTAAGEGWPVLVVIATSWTLSQDAVMLSSVQTGL